jgi:hypothetical protein
MKEITLKKTIKKQFCGKTAVCFFGIIADNKNPGPHKWRYF